MTDPFESNFQYVGMGEVKTGARDDVLRATLGSCIGIGLLWPKGGRCALAHCLLPASPAPMIRIGARYVSQAVPSLLLLLCLKPSDYPDVEIIVAGGARMFRTRPGVAHVGELNIQATLQCLAQHGLKAAHVEVGGRRGRQITIDCARQSFAVNEIERQPEEAPDEHSRQPDTDRRRRRAA